MEQTITNKPEKYLSVSVGIMPTEKTGSALIYKFNDSVKIYSNIFAIK